MIFVMTTLTRVKYVLCALLFFATSAWGATYYVDYVGGDDTNNGTSTSTPFKHCPGDQDDSNNADISLSAGDTVIFKGGVTYEFDEAGNNYIEATTSGTSGNEITYTSGHTQGAPWGTGRAVIDCTNATPNAASKNGCLHLANYAYLIVEDIEIKNLAENGGVAGYDTVGLIGWNDSNNSTDAQLVIDNVYAHTSNGAGIILRGGYNDGETATNATVKNCTVENTFGHGIKIEYEWDTVLIENNEVDQCGDDPYTSGSPAGNPIALTSNDNNNTGQTNITVRGNTLDDSTPSGNKSHMLLHTQDNLIIEDNSFKGTTYTSSLDFVTEIDNLTVRNNVWDVTVSDLEGLLRFKAQEATAGGDTLNFYNNTIVGELGLADKGIFHFECHSDDDVAYTNVDIRNNIIDTGTDTNAYLIWIDNTEDGSDVPVVQLSTLTIDYNAYQSLNSSSDYFYITDGAAGGRTFAEWKSWLSTGGASGADANSQFGQVTFNDESGDDFTLDGADSTALNLGATLSVGFTDDRIGVSRPQGAAWDIGAYEFFTGTTIATEAEGSTTIGGAGSTTIGE
jgi:hypothetical protein